MNAFYYWTFCTLKMLCGVVLWVLRHSPTHGGAKAALDCGEYRYIKSRRSLAGPDYDSGPAFHLPHLIRHNLGGGVRGHLFPGCSHAYLPNSSGIRMYEARSAREGICVRLTIPLSLRLIGGANAGVYMEEQTSLIVEDGQSCGRSTMRNCYICTLS